ncbi:MAG: aminotransferase class V-fold PLP-dependent enzyme [Cellulomonadaceae bacterium]|jgi:selenocysteine lyase/cysteine desulfurase|nr:aminotransferase class V-fold PLP-dependent enzyme [Cellulomonadaceae bacterium]
MIFGRSTRTHASAQPASPAPGQTGGPGGLGALQDVGNLARYGFEYLPADQVYMDSACQTLRPQPVIDAMNEYFLTYNACGERVQYEWGKKIDERVETTRASVLKALGKSPKKFTAAFTLNTTYGLNLLLTQVPAGRFARVITTHTEHNSVFLSTMACAARAGVERILLDRNPADGSLILDGVNLTDALVVVSAMNNVTGATTPNLADLIDATHKAGGIVIIDAAQAMPHAPALVKALDADAICFSAHKTYGASLGVVVARNDLLASLDLNFIGGGQVTSVTADSYELLPELHTRLEAGLQPWGEIIALDAALTWLDGFARGAGEALEVREHRLSTILHAGLTETGKLDVLSQPGSSLVTVEPRTVDGHRLATFLSKAGIMVRSGYFCAHHWLIDLGGYSPLVRFSLGAHTTDDDIARTLDVTSRLMKGL